MKYLYYWSWLLLAFIFKSANRVFRPIGHFLLNIIPEKKLQRIQEFKKLFLAFPGGFIDWGAYGLVLGVIYAIIIFSVIGFGIETWLFESRYSLTLFFIGIAVVTYYEIYYRTIKWLKSRITQ
jgi:hypothetical protein